MNTNQLTRAIIRYFELRGDLVWRNNTGAFPIQDATHRRRFFRAGAKGSGDIFVVLAPRGEFLSVEVKAGRDRVRESQIEWIHKVERAGGLTLIARSLDDVVEWCAKHK
jgi:hypothetical protein